MIQLTTKINHRVSGLVITLCLVIFAVIFGYYWFFITFQAIPQDVPVQRVNSQTAEIRAGRSQFFEAASTFRRYGNWPIVNVPLSADRGNPFAPK